MTKIVSKAFSLITILALMLAALPMQSVVASGSISLTTLGTAFTENFDTLSNTAGSTTNSLAINGWSMTESGGGARDNEQYAVDTGGSTTGDTYSYGAAASTDRALGGLRSGTLIPVFGANFTNNTGSTITSLDVAYTGEEWRLGTAARTDQINFEYSNNATDLVTGTWTGVASLNFVTPDTVTTGAKNGNAVSDRTVISATISGLSIPNGTAFWIRWTDTDATGADDGLTVDDFSITPQGSAQPSLSINDVAANEGDSGITTFTFTVSLSASAGAGGVTFDIASADNTATSPSDFTANGLTGQTIPEGSSIYTFDVLVNGDTTVEPNETFFVNVANVTGATIADGQGQGAIQNDDVAPTPTDPSGVGLATPNGVAAGGSSLLTVAVTPGTNPTSTGLAVSCNLSAIGGSASQMFFDNASNGDVTTGDNTFSFQTTVNNATALGAKSLPCTITDAESRSGSASISLTVLLPAGSVVISQVYGGGGNSGATFKNDFIELYNRSSNSIDLTGWSVQYAAAGGTSWQVTSLSGSIAPGKYYLVQEAAGAGGTLNLPTPDAIGTTAMSATAAKVALVSNVTALTGACPTASNISDLVGYGATASCFEGSGRAPAPSNTTAILRLSDGAQDTDSNSADFVIGASNPRNSSFPFVAVGSAVPANVLTGETTLLTVAVTPGTDPVSTGITVSCNLSSIGGASNQTLYDDGTHGDQSAGDNTFSFTTTDGTAGTQNLLCTFADAQGRNGTNTITVTLLTALPIGTVNGPVGNTDDGMTHRSPYAPSSGNGTGQTVLIEGVIYETTLQATSFGDSYKGFYIQNTVVTADTDPNTSDGLFVFMNTNSTMSGPSGAYTPTVGDEVVISGTISEYFNMTELSNPTLVKPVLRSGVDLDAELALVIANPPASLADANRYWERLQGMRLQVPQNSIVLGGRNVFSPADAEVWVASPDSMIAQRLDPYERRAFRDAHPLDDNYDANNWDGNGYRILMGSLGIKSTANDAQALIAPARTFDTVTNAPVGGLNYTFSKYRIEISTQPTLSDGPDPSANHPPQVFDRSIHYTIADYNVENLYDYRDNPFSGCDFASDTGCPQVAPFLSAVTPPYDYVPASDAAYQARLNDISLEIINDLHSPDIIMAQEVENQDICTVTGSVLTCGTTDNADGKPDDLQELALKIAANGGPVYDAAFDRNSSDLRGIAPSFMYRTDRVQLLPAAGDPVLGGAPAIAGYTSVPYDSDVSNPKTLNAVYNGTGACETSYVFPRAPDVGLFRIYSTSVGVGSYRDVYVIDNHFKSGPDTCVAHRTEQANFNAALVAYIQAANPNARIVLGGDLNVYPRPDDPFAPIGQPGSSDQLGALYNPSLGLKSLWEVELSQSPESAYSYVYLGMAQTIDHMFVNQPMLADLTQYRIAHINSDFPADYTGDVARGTSDHDPGVATFLINDSPMVDAGGSYFVNEGNSVTLTATGTDPEGQPLTYAWDLDNNGTFETSGQSVSFASVDGPATATVKVQVTDNGGLSAIASASVTVNNVAPTAGFSASTSVNEGTSFGLSLINPVDVPTDLGSLQYAFDCGAGYGVFSTSYTTTCAAVDNPGVTVKGKVQDKDGGVTEYVAPVTINNIAPVVGAITAPASPVKVLTGVNASANFTDPGTLDTHIAVWNWGDGTTSNGVVNESNGSGSVTGSHSYSKAGLYNIILTVTDKDGGSKQSTSGTVVVYDPNAGFVTGAVAFNSPVGAYADKPTKKGPAAAAFTVAYPRNGTLPIGNLQLAFPNGALQFSSTSFDWLVVNSVAKTTQFQGNGKINGQGNYKFMVWTSDAHPDTFRIKVWNQSGTVIYDSGVQPISSGVILIVK